jgi:hypothetical protein
LQVAVVAAGAFTAAAVAELVAELVADLAAAAEALVMSAILPTEGFVPHTTPAIRLLQVRLVAALAAVAPLMWSAGWLTNQVVLASIACPEILLQEAVVEVAYCRVQAEAEVSLLILLVDV